MGQNQVKGDDDDAESPRGIISLVDIGGGGGQELPNPHINYKFPLHLAAWQGNFEKVSELLLNGGGNDCDDSSLQSNPLLMTRCLDDYGRTPLHCATRPTSHHNLAVIQLLLQRDKEDNSSSVKGGKPWLANLQDVSHNTALHHAAASHEARLVSLLLEFGADPNLKDGEGSTPLHILAESNSDSARECAKLILDSGSLSRSAGIQTNANGQTPAYISTKCTAPKLLELFVGRGFDCASLDHVDRTTPLMVACSKEDGGDWKETLECVRLLLGVYSPEQVNAKDKYGNTALHMAALHQRFKILKLLVSSPKTDLFTKDAENFTVFHYAIWGNSLSCVKFLCECEQMRSKDKFVEIIFHSHERKKRGDLSALSPVQLALNVRHTKMVDYFLAAHPNPDAWVSDEKLMDLIYSESPTALVSRMNQSLKYPPTAVSGVVKVDFRVIAGVKDPVEEWIEETNNLYKIRDIPKEDQKVILLHPLVQIFLERKWERIRELTWIHITLQLSWLFCYTLMVYEMYAPNCHGDHDTTTAGGNNQTQTEEKGGGGGVEGKGKGHLRILHSLGFLPWEEDCRINQVAVQVTALILYLLSTLVLVKEAFQLRIKCYSYFWDITNWAQLGLLIVAVANSVPAWRLQGSGSSASGLAPWQTNVAAIGIFVAWVMLLSELDDFPKFALYSAILKTVLWNFLKTMLFYCPLLIGFAMCLRILTPGKGQYNYLLFSIVKVVVMMTGELDYDETFYGGDKDDVAGPSLANRDILGQIIFLLLAFVTTIVLLNLLTGLAVANVKKLLEDADVNRLSLQLERMYMLESFILFAREKLSGFDFWKYLLYRWNATAERGSNNKYMHKSEAWVFIKDYPAELQARIREVMVVVEEE